jgi:hypothetical protein
MRSEFLNSNIGGSMNISRRQLEEGPVRLEFDGIQVVVMTLSDYEDLLDSRDPELRARVSDSHQDYVAGRFRPATEFLRELSKE